MDNLSRNDIMSLLKAESLETILDKVGQLPPRKAVTALLTGICHTNSIVKWHAVSALGAAMALLADKDMESAREIVRRLMWSLNNESGGIGWGAPEALGDIMSRHPLLAAEYAFALVAYMREDGPHLNHPALQKGLLWGVGRLSETGPDLLRKLEASVRLLPCLDSEDCEIRGLAARALGLLRADEAREKLVVLKDDPAELVLYGMNGFETTTVGRLATEALASLD
jgi:hypothetical protein